MSVGVLASISDLLILCYCTMFNRHYNRVTRKVPSGEPWTFSRSHAVIIIPFSVLYNGTDLCCVGWKDRPAEKVTLGKLQVQKCKRVVVLTEIKEVMAYSMQLYV